MKIHQTIPKESTWPKHSEGKNCKKEILRSCALENALPFLALSLE